MTGREFNGQLSEVQASKEAAALGQCPECHGDVRTVGGESTCNECGLVIAEDWLDRGPEWQVFDADNRERTGAPLTSKRHDKGLSTEIGYGRDANGNTISGKKRRQLGRLRREHSRGRWRSKADRNLAFGLSEVRRIVGALELPDTVCEQACTLFRSAQNEDLLRGRSIEAFAAGSVYAVCRCNGLPRTIEEVGSVARCETSAVENAYDVLNRELGLPARPPLAQDFLPRLASELEVSETVQSRALELAREADEAGLVNGCKPSGFAAACLYVVAREAEESLTQKSVARTAGVSTATVRANRESVQQLVE